MASNRSLMRVALAGAKSMRQVQMSKLPLASTAAAPNKAIFCRRAPFNPAKDLPPPNPQVPEELYTWPVEDEIRWCGLSGTFYSLWNDKVWNDRK